MKRLFIQSLAVFNTVEGILHIIMALISLWGCWDTGVWDWRVMSAPVTDLAFGAFSIITGYVLGMGFHLHMPHDHKDQK